MLSKRTLLVAVFVGSGFVLACLFYFFLKEALIQNGSTSLTASTTVLPEQEKVESILGPLSPAGEPTRLKIPVIYVDAAVEPVGLTAAGVMDVPKNQDDVAWFKLGPRPGEKGSAVIAGHYGRTNEKASVFDSLYKLRPGDKLSVEDDKGEIVYFVVRASQRYDPSVDTSAIFSSKDGQSHLNLITCEGAWKETVGSYSRRLVIFTDKE